MTQKEYLIKLKALCDKIDDKFTYNIFFRICKQYTQFLLNQSKTKSCTKKEIMDYLISKGLMDYKFDIKTNEYVYPDDRKVRATVRRLMRSGYPILSNASNAGYYICDNTKEIKIPQEQDKTRALKLLAMQKSYDIMSNFVMGQIDIEDMQITAEEDINEEN